VADLQRSILNGLPGPERSLSNLSNQFLQLDTSSPPPPNPEFKAKDGSKPVADAPPQLKEITQKEYENFESELKTLPRFSPGHSPVLLRGRFCSMVMAA